MRPWFILMLILTLLPVRVIFAWTIGAKGRATGPAFHTTYFLTPNNQWYRVAASAYVGSIINGSCQYEAFYDMGSERLHTGDSVDLDAFAVKSTIGGGFECMVIHYRLQQRATESFQLYWDGMNYIGSFPPTSVVTLM